MKTVKQTYLIHAPIEEVWQALINPSYIDEWGGGPAKMDDKAGTKFSLWGGTVWGTNIEVIPHKKLVQEWYSKEEIKWDKPSILTFTLQKDEDNVRLELFQTDVPDADAKNIEKGWKEYYLGPLKQIAESK